MSFDLGATFLERSRYYLATEYPAKIRAAIASLPGDRLWWRPNEQANSAGNLLLHLAGNVRQWIVSGVGGAPDLRDRQAEFAARDGAGLDALLATFDAAVRESDAVLAALTPADLATTRHIQGRDTTVFNAVYHVVEHFAGHTGQIILIAKWCTPGAVRFYDDADGLARPLFIPDGATDI